MNKIVLMILVSMTVPAWAGETALKCVENGNENAITIRFDAERKTFHLTGKATWVVRKHRGEAAVKSVTFEPNKITVRFKKRGVRFLALGAIAAGAASSGTGVLDRVLGTWTLGPHTYKCTRVTDKNRKF
jgi:hypothetical protein